MCFCYHHLFASSHLFWIDFLFLTLFLFSLFVLFSEQVIERTIAKWNSQRPGMASSFCWLTNIVILRTERIRWSCSGSVMNFTNRNVKRKWRQWKEIALELLFLMIHTYICRCARHSHEDDNNNSELDFFFRFFTQLKNATTKKFIEFARIWRYLACQHNLFSFWHLIVIEWVWKGGNYCSQRSPTIMFPVENCPIWKIVPKTNVWMLLRENNDLNMFSTSILS